MTVLSTANRLEYAGAGSTGPYTIPTALQGISTAYIKATRATSAGVETELTLNAGSDGFTVNSGITEITLTEALASGETLVITPGVPLTQGTDLLANDSFDAELLEDAVDKLTLIVQQLDEAIARAILLPITASSTNVTIPDPSGNADKVVRVNSAGTDYILDTGTASGLVSLVDDTTPQLGGDLDLNGNQIVSPDSSDWFTIVNGEMGFTTNNTERLSTTDAGTRLGGSGARVTTILDEDSMVSNSATALATQQSIRAYVDARDSYVFIESVTASDDASIAFTGLSSVHSAYVAVCNAITPTTDAAVFQLRTSTNNGSSFSSGASDYGYCGLSVGTSTASADEQAATASFIKVFDNTGSDTAENGSAIVHIIDPAGAHNTFVHSRACKFASSGEFFYEDTSGFRANSGGAVNAIQFTFSAGNIESGTITLYGIKSS